MSEVKNILVVLNPSAGTKNPPLRTLNHYFTQPGFDWDLKITKDFGDGIEITRQAVKDGVDLVAAFGGDGTVMEVACGIKNTGIPMAILPSGTGNILTMELGIPHNIESACELIVNEELSRQRHIDLGITHDEDFPGFALRAGVGLEANLLEGTARDLKERYGIFAYLMGSVPAFRDIKESHYHLTLDGESMECNGLTCLIANAGNFGVPGLTLDPKVKIDDGLLDVFVISKMDLLGLFSLAASVVGGSEKKDPAHHWQAQSIKIEADPVQPTQADGEMWGKSPVDISVNPGALNVIVPK